MRVTAYMRLSAMKPRNCFGQPIPRASPPVVALSQRRSPSRRQFCRTRHGRRTPPDQKCCVDSENPPSLTRGVFVMPFIQWDQAPAAGRALDRWSAPNLSAHLYRPRHRPCPRLGRRATHPTQSAGRRPERPPAVGHPQEPEHRRETEVRPGWERRPGRVHPPPAHRPCPRLGRPPARTRHPLRLLHPLHRLRLLHPLRLLHRLRRPQQLPARRLRPPIRTCTRHRPFSRGQPPRLGPALSRHRKVQCQQQL